jgi:hypothetical protein
MLIAVLTFYPLLVLLERGQVDAFTLLLLMLGFLAMIVHSRDLAAGLLFALAVLLKLHVVLLVPFLLLRRKWKALAGLCAGIAMILAAGVLVNGWRSTVDYFRTELPRISRSGEGGTPDQRLPKAAIGKYLIYVPPDATLKGGRMYQKTCFEFAANATLVRTPVGDLLQALGARLHLDLSASTLSVMIFGTAFLLLAALGARLPAPGNETDFSAELRYWLLALTLILLCAPLSWATNAIWLTPLAVLLVEQYQRLTVEPLDDAQRLILPVGLAAGAIGFFLAAMPDALGFQMVTAYGQRFFYFKYVAAEALLILWLASSLVHRRGLAVKSA